MQLYLILASLVLTHALALPLPDEEVSPLQAAAAGVPEVKSNVVPRPEEKLALAVKSEERLTEGPAIKPAEEKKIELPPSTPDAEIALLPPEKKESKKDDKLQKKEVKLEDKRDEKISEKKPDKLNRSEDPSEKVKSLPNVNTPIAAAPAEIEAHIADDIPTNAQEAEFKGSKLADNVNSQVAEQKREELSAAEVAPAVKSDIQSLAPSTVLVAEPAAAEISEKKIEESSDRQDREKQEATEENAAKKIESDEKIEKVTEEKQSVEATAELLNPALKTLPTAERKSDDKHLAVGDILLHSSEENKALRSVSESELKKNEDASNASSSSSTEEKKLEPSTELPKSKTEIKEKSAIESKKNNESKESEESSKESEESKEEKNN